VAAFVYILYRDFLWLLIILDGRAPHHGGWWLIGPGEWAIRVELFSLLGVDAWASLMGHTEERADSDLKRGT
jgi:hypothetical protein